MSISTIKKNDFFAIEQSIVKYLKKEITLLSMISSIEMLANATFDSSETRELYNFIINYIGDIEILYFMKGEEISYHDEVISLVMEFQKKLNKYAPNNI